MRPVQDLPVRRSRRWVLAVVILAVVGAIAGTAAVLATRVPASVVADGGTPESPTPSVASTPPAASEAPAQPEIDTIMRSLEQALISGNRGAWLAPIGPEVEPKVRKLFENTYDNLRALKVTGIKLSGRVGNGELDTVNVKFEMSACFGKSPCTNGQRPITSDSRMLVTESESVGAAQIWKRGADKKLKLSFQTDTSGVLPWYTATGPKLAGMTEGRITIAGPEAVKSKLRGWMPIAREAVQRAERFQVRGTKPLRYLIYLADDKAWKSWFDHSPAAWVAGYYPGLSNTTTRSVVIHDNAARSALAKKFLLRHELGHAVTLDEPGDSDNEYWWLTEGLAEYVSFSDYGPDFYFGSSLRSWFRKHKPTGIGPLGGPKASSSDDEVDGMYALAYASIDCLAHQYGEKAMLNFFSARVLNRVAADEASHTYFKKPWAQVSKGCAGYLQSIVR